MAYLKDTAGKKREASKTKRETLSDPAARKSVQSDTVSIGTTGNTDAFVIVPEDGTLDSADFSATTALAASDSNYITFSITNLGQDGAGSNAMLAASNGNTTKATGGAALTANAKRSLSLHGTAGNLAVVAGDRLRVRFAVTGTLGGAIAGAVALLRFKGTT